jgi:hypothetical protein
MFLESGCRVLINIIKLAAHYSARSVPKSLIGIVNGVIHVVSEYASGDVQNSMSVLLNSNAFRRTKRRPVLPHSEAARPNAQRSR